MIEQHPQIVTQLCSSQQSPIRSSNAHPSSISQNSSHHKNFSDSLPFVSPNTSVLDCGAEKDQSKYMIQPLPFDRIPIQQSTSENPFISQRALFADPQTSLTPPNPFARVIHSNPQGEKNKKVLRANVKELELKSKAEYGSGSIGSARKKRRIEQSDSEDELEELEIGLKVGMSFED